MPNVQNIVKEVCVETYEEALMAQDLGADRIELCSALNLDGLTPDRHLIKKTLKNLSIPIKVMIRPRSGNFNYSKNELGQMHSDIDFCKYNGVDEVVFGLLDKYKNIDLRETRKLAERARPMKITFHKAIDNSQNIFGALKVLSSIPEIKSILTSGQGRFILDNENIVEQILSNYRDRFNIILAGGITKKNFNEIHGRFNALEYHGKHIIGKIF